MHHSSIRGAAAAALALLAPIALAASPHYTAIFLNPQKGTFLTGSGMSSTAVTGTSFQKAHGPTQGFILTEDREFTTFSAPNAVYTYVTGINNSQTVIGYSEDAANGFSDYMRNADGTFVDLDFTPLAINDSGVIAATVAGTTTSLPAQWKDGVLTTLPTLGFGDNSYGNQPFAINDSGVMSGSVETSVYGVEEAVMWKDGALIELPTLSAYSHFGKAISSNDIVAGTCFVPNGDSFISNACMWRNGTVTNLGLLVKNSDAEAFGVNAAGTVVGAAWANGSDGHHAFVYTHGKMFDLNTLTTLPGGYYLNTGVSIDDQGNILATAFRGNSPDTFTFLLRPTN